MKGGRGKIIYVGKAGSLKKRVSSYFLKAHDGKIEKLISEIKKIDYIETATAIEALILESQLIKKYNPPYNFKSKDDTSFWYVEITKEDFPRVLLVRGKDLAEKKGSETFGPFTNASDLRAALRIIRKIFPYSTHDESKIGKARRPCIDAQINLCPGTCVGGIDKKSYEKNIRNIRLLFRGKKEKLIQTLEKDMLKASKALDFEEAEILKRQLFALSHIQDIALITNPDLSGLDDKKPRIEGYDISNISGDSAVGSMVVFSGDRPVKNAYRKFKIRTINQPDDTGMLKEMIERRANRIPPTGNWPAPDLILVDGGRGQVNVTKAVLENAGIKIPVVGIAKGPTRKKNEFIGSIPKGISEETLIRVRDEAHRFAISYHKQLRSANFIKR